MFSSDSLRIAEISVMIFSLTRFGDLLFERRAVDVERNFRDDELLAVALHLLHADAPAQLDAALAGREIILDALDAADESRRSENPGP